MKDLERFGLTSQDVSSLNERTTLIKKWNWDYAQAHAFQRHVLELLDKDSQRRYLVCCSHPRVFTNGRGLQKPRKGENLNLVEFDSKLVSQLPYPFFQIERGGGLTFHHPGQMIIYPILRLNPKTLSLSAMIDQLFDAAIDVLASWGLQGLSHENKLLGLWAKERKIASMGIAVEKLTTFHGMALNFHRDEEMMMALRKVNPCGLEASTYVSVEELLDLKTHTLDEFATLYLRRLAHGWQ
jgi:lipoyl(octanoyl) transferase